MTKELRTRVEKAFGALEAAVIKNPRIAGEAIALIRDLQKDFRGNAQEAYRAGVAMRKADRDEKRATKANAVAEAKRMKDEAKAKFAAALAIRVNGKVAARRPKKDPIDAALGQVDPTNDLESLVDLPALETTEPEIF